MKSFKTTSLIKYGMIFLLVSFIINLINADPFFLPHISIFFMFVFFERALFKRIFFSLTPFIIFSWISPPLPFFLLVAIYIQCFFLSTYIYSVKALDVRVLSVLYAIISHIIISFMAFLVSSNFTGSLNLTLMFTRAVSGVFLIITFTLFYREKIDELFIRDTWS
ncbi:MAG: hypothetical protein R6W70_06400 [bacterium]